MPRTLLIALLTLLALTGPAAGALASGRDVLNDCTDDEVMSKTYTQKEYRDALARLPADADQYGNCRDIIARAQDAAVTKGSKGKTTRRGGTTTTGGSGAIGSAPGLEQLQAATPTERKAVQEAGTTNRALDLDNPTVDATKVGTVPGVSSASDLPTPLAIVLALLLVAALTLAALRIRSLVHARRA